MKHSSPPQSATSIPRAPRDDAHARMTKYFIMMSVRVGCFVLMVVITPYGWHTGILAVGAILLPYVAVVVANVGSDSRPVRAVPPGRELEAFASPADAPDLETVTRITETKPESQSRHAPEAPDAPRQGDA